MISGYAVAVEEEGGALRVYGTGAKTFEDGAAILRVARLTYPNLFKDAKVYELREVEG